MRDWYLLEDDQYKVPIDSVTGDPVLMPNIDMPSYKDDIEEYQLGPWDKKEGEINSDKKYYSHLLDLNKGMDFMESWDNKPEGARPRQGTTAPSCATSRFGTTATSLGRTSTRPSRTTTT